MADSKLIRECDGATGYQEYKSAKPRHAGGGMHWPNPHGTAAFTDEPSTPDGHSAEQQPRLRPSSFGRKATHLNWLGHSWCN